MYVPRYPVTPVTLDFQKVSQDKMEMTLFC